MNKVLVVISSFRWGGICKSLSSLLSIIDTQAFQVDLFALVPTGIYSDSFPNCSILPCNKVLGSLLDQKEYQNGLNRIKFVLLKVINKLSKGQFQHWLYNKVGNNLVTNKKYDAVIAWGEGIPTIFISHIEHPNKIAWTHWDYSQYTNGPTERDTYNKFQSIVCVSKYTRNVFLSYYPEMESKVHTIYNVLNSERIKSLAKEPMDFEYSHDTFNIVSVGRFAPVKRFSYIPEIAKKIIDAGLRIKWYIIGPYCIDNEYMRTSNSIDNLGLKDIVFITDGKINPYPYIMNANLLVCTSISESWSYTINEAKVLGIPSVSTNFGAAPESIENGVTGFISNFEEIHDIIIKMISDKTHYEAILKNLSTFEYDNISILKEIDYIINPSIIR